jgi:putative transcriptional regulator
MAADISTRELATEYACGSVSPGLALLMRAHAETSPEGRRRIATAESLAGALLSEGPEARMEEGALEATLAMLDGPSAPPAAEPPALETGPLPRPVVEAANLGFDRIPWRTRLPGVSEYVLEGFGPEKVSLLRARPGARVPQHTHDGCEYTLVMTGAMQDGARMFRRGDIAVNDEDDDHRPEIVGEELCYCLIVLEGRLRFTGRFSRALNYLAE